MTYDSDPFFRQRVNVEIEKVQTKLENQCPNIIDG
jgi:hypothetical protein